MVGAHLLYFLLKENEVVRGIHRNASDREAVKRIFKLYSSDYETVFKRIDWVEADILDIPELTKAFVDVNRVFHCAASINFNPSKYKFLKKVNVEGTANIVNLCLANKVEKLCYVSSVATFGSARLGKEVNENSEWNPDEKNNVYAITKYAGEMEVWRGTQEGLDALIVNPGIILGTSPNEAGSGIIPSLASRGVSYYPSGGMGIIDVQDVVKAMILLMKSGIKNDQFILVSQNISYKDILSRFAVVYGKNPPTKKLSKTLMGYLSGIDWISNILFGTKRRLPKSLVKSMFTISSYSSSKIKDAIGFKFTPLEETINRIFEEGKRI